MDEIIKVVEEATGTTVVGYSEVAREGDITWYLFKLADGRWAATDDAEAALDRVNVYATRDEAIRDLWDAWLEAGGDRSDRVCWLLPEPADAQYRYSADELNKVLRKWCEERGIAWNPDQGDGLWVREHQRRLWLEDANCPAEHQLDALTPQQATPSGIIHLAEQWLSALHPGRR